MMIDYCKSTPYISVKRFIPTITREPENERSPTPDSKNGLF